MKIVVINSLPLTFTRQVGFFRPRLNEAEATAGNEERSWVMDSESAPRDNGAAFDKVKTFLQESKTLPPEVVEARVKELEDDIYTLFRSLEKIRSKHPEFEELALSDDFYALVRMLEHSSVKKKFPLLARAAAMF